MLNPLIRPADVEPSRPDFEVIGAFNPGVTKVGDETVLLLRVAERPREREDGWHVSPWWDAERGEIACHRVRANSPDLHDIDERVFWQAGLLHLTSISHLRVARSTDGERFTVEPKPAVFPLLPTEAYGIEDPRITFVEGRYRIACKVVSSHGIAVALIETDDFRAFERRGIILCPENLDVVIFPERVGGEFAALTRPVGRHSGPPEIWLGRSPDMVHWGRHEPVLVPRPGRWDAGRVGASAVPFRVEGGWLEIYHGADPANRYCTGAALLDGDDPSRLLARSEEPLLFPQEPYETHGFFGGVVFASGATVDESGKVAVYYGAADESTCVAFTTVTELMATLPARTQVKPYRT